MNSRVFGPISRSNQGLLEVFSTVSGAWNLKKSFAANMLSARISQIGKSRLPKGISPGRPVLCTNPQHDLPQNRQFFLFLDLFCFLNGSTLAVPMTIRPCLISQAAVVWQRSTSWLSAEDVNLAHLWFGGVWKWLHPPNRHFNGEHHLPNHRIYSFSRIFRKFSVGKAIL